LPQIPKSARAAGNSPSWQGHVYSRARGINYLEEYARQYNTVEVDQWFWSLFKPGVKLPAVDDVRGYRDSVPDSFRFSVKVPNSITLTHYYQRDKSKPLEPNPHYLSVELFKAFLSSLCPMHDLLGPLIFQFEYLNRQKMPFQKQFLSRFSVFISEIPSGYTYGLETRNQNYLNARYFDFLLENRICPVFLQGYWMPSMVDLYDKWRDRIIQHSTVVIRLHGPHRTNIEEKTGKQWNRIVEPRDAELDGIGRVAGDLRDNDVEVYLNVNNHYEGCAPLTIQRIRERIDDQG
jgi:uncharacterized protein YecE (DUF72 family)